LVGFSIFAAFMPKIKAGRSITVDTLCDFSEADNHMPKVLHRWCFIFYNVYLKFSFIHLIDYPLFIDVSKC
jgi:hypothetical protein